MSAPTTTPSPTDVRPRTVPTAELATLLRAVVRAAAAGGVRAARHGGPATLLRRELHFPGWTASMNGNDSDISEHRGLFQAIALPSGKSDTRFRYAPPHIVWSWLVALAACAGLLLPGRRR